MKVCELAFTIATLLLLSCEARTAIQPGSRIINGESVDIKDYPYQVLIMSNGLASCGGSILKANFILTAAHCTYGVTASTLTVRAGSSLRTSGGQVVQVKAINQHEDFDPDTYDYDICILELASSLTLGSGVALVKLPSSSDDVTNGESTIVTGWGTTDANVETLATQLQMVVLPAITTKSCQNYYGSYVTARMFCAGYAAGGKDACQGDSGGPLVINGVQYGITSWGDVCAQANTPGVYTKIPSLRSFIDKIIG